MASTKPVLNPEQQLVVQHHYGPMRVASVAGSGKTTAVVERVAYLIKKHAVSPTSILMISFSRIAAAEMKRRINKRLPGIGADKCVRTFHSLGLLIFKNEIDGHDEMEIDNSGLLYIKAGAEAYRSMGIEPERKALKAFSSAIKNNMIGTNETLRRLGRIDPRMANIAEKACVGSTVNSATLIEAFYKAETIRAKTGVDHKGIRRRFVTLDDMIYETAMALKRGAVRQRWAKRWDFVLQDEAQDVNPAQDAIAEALCREHRNYMVVGDPCQSIFQFRGATPEKILRFEEEWPTAKTVVMHRNYRSGVAIVNLANSIMECMPADTVITDDMGFAKDMVSERNTKSYIGYHVFQTPKDEARHVATNISAHQRDGLKWSDQAVLLRMNYMTRHIELALAEKDIPYKLVSGQSFFTLREAKIVFAYLRMLAGRGTPEDVETSLMYPSRKLGKAFVKTVIDAKTEEGDWFDAIEAARQSAKPYQSRAVMEWIALMSGEQHPLRRGDFGSFIDRFFSRLKLKDWLQRQAGDEEDSKALQNFNEVLAFARSHSGVDVLLDTIDRIEKHRAAHARKRDAVTVSTVHKMKGAERNVIYIVQVADGLFPVSQSDLTEERRIFYVAVTRAMDELWISYSHEVDNREEDVDESPLLYEVGMRPGERYRHGRATDALPVGSQIGLSL
jgi:DNA helicase-2/ATP-dependent DNA helicase PcrA